MSGLFSMKAAMNSVEPTEEIEVTKIENVQKELLGVYADVVAACNKHGLKLFLQGGTLLGKVRHNGFIPWDDDMDLGLVREDYDRLEYVFKQELSDNYLLRKPGYEGGTRTRFAQIYKKNSITSRMIWIDIFPIDFVPDNIIKRTAVGVLSNMVMGIAGSVEFFKVYGEETRRQLLRSPKGAINYYLRKLVAAVFGGVELEKWYGTLEVLIRNNRQSSYCTSATGRWHYFGEMQKSEVFFPLKRTRFCDIDAWTINKEDHYLRHNYGADYMSIPSKEKRERHS